MDPRLADLIARYLAAPGDPLRLVIHTGSPTSAQGTAALALARDIAAAVSGTRIVRVDTSDASASEDPDAPPTIVIDGPGIGGRLRYRGVPRARELEGFVAALGLVASRPSPASVDRVRNVRQPVEILVFVTPTCWQCPEVVGAAQRLAHASPFITTTVVDATEHPDLVRSHQVMGVPKLVASTGLEILGPVDEAEMARALTASLARPAADPGRPRC